MKKFFKHISRFNGIRSANRKRAVISPSRKDLERKVEEGPLRAVKEYKEVFERLAKYDRE